MSMLYDFRDYDKHMCLKLSLEMWLVIVYLLRPFILMFSTLRMGRGAGPIEGVDGLKQMIYPDNFSLSLGILATFPVLLFIVAWMKRKPSSGTFVRGVWHHGVRLLSTAAVLNIVIVFVPIMTGVITRVHLAGWAQIGISFAIIAYLYTSRRVKDTFADFPVESSE